MVKLATIAAEIILEAMERVTSADKAYRLLRDMGYDVTRSIVRERWREVGVEDTWTTVLKTYGYGKVTPRDWVTDMPSKTATGYGYTMRATMFDPKTDTTTEEIYSARTDKLTRYSDIMDILEPQIYQYAEERGLSIVSIEIENVMEFIPGGR